MASIPAPEDLELIKKELWKLLFNTQEGFSVAGAWERGTQLSVLAEVRVYFCLSYPILSKPAGF